MTSSARLMPMFIASRTRLSLTSGRSALKPKYISWKLGLASSTLSSGDFLAWSMNCVGKCGVMSMRPLSMAARRLESSGTCRITRRSNFTGPGFLYIGVGPHL